MTSPFNTLNDRRTKLVDLEGRLHSAIEYSLERKTVSASHMGEKLALLDPFSPLKRGYAIAFGKDGAITRADALKEGDELRLKFADGEADTRVVAVNIQ